MLLGFFDWSSCFELSWPWGQIRHLAGGSVQHVVCHDGTNSNCKMSAQKLATRHDDMHPNNCEPADVGDDQGFHPVVSTIEDQANNILNRNRVTVDDIRLLLDHPDIPWQRVGNGLQVTLGAARLSLTEATSAPPKFTKVFTQYFQQCNCKAYGSTIVINKNLKTDLHIDSRNEKLPAFLTAITHFKEGELFLQSAIGDDFYGKQRVSKPLSRWGAL